VVWQRGGAWRKWNWIGRSWSRLPVRTARLPG